MRPANVQRHTHCFAGTATLPLHLLSPLPPPPSRPPLTLPILKAANMASANALLHPHRANEDENHDQIGSNCSTPPGGAATPRPDPIDKRLPGILHSYFGQVRDSLISRRTSSVTNNPPLAPTSAQDPAALKEKESDSGCLRSNKLPSPTPSASSVSRSSSTAKLNGESEKLTQGDFSPLSNQATPPQTPRTRSQESKPLPSNLSQTTLASSTKSTMKPKESKETKAPAVGPPKGKLSLSISEGRGLRPSVDPYVVCQFQWAEYISEGPKHETPKDRKASGRAVRRIDGDMGKPMAIPMKSRQSSNSGQSSDPRENGTFKEVTDPKWEHDAILYV